MAEAEEGRREGVCCLAVSLGVCVCVCVLFLSVKYIYISFLLPSTFLPFLDYHLQGMQELQPTRVLSRHLSFAEIFFSLL